MSSHIMIPSLSTIFASVLNLAHQTQPELNKEQLVGRSFCIAIDELPQDIAIYFDSDGIKQLADNEIADVSISGNLKSVIAMITSQEQGFNDDELYIAGKISTAQQFQKYLSQFKFDWEELFARCMSQENASKIAVAVEQTLHMVKGGAEEMQQAFKDYILEEKKLLVTHSEFEFFKESIEQLHGRINILFAHLEKK